MRTGAVVFRSSVVATPSLMSAVRQFTSEILRAANAALNTISEPESFILPEGFGFFDIRSTTGVMSPMRSPSSAISPAIAMLDIDSSARIQAGPAGAS